MEIVVSIDQEPYERILEVDGTFHEGSKPKMNYGGLPQPGEPPTFSPTDVEWHESDPLDGKGDVDEFYESHEEEVHRQALEKESKRYENRMGSHPDV